MPAWAIIAVVWIVVIPAAVAAAAWIAEIGAERRRRAPDQLAEVIVLDDRLRTGLSARRDRRRGSVVA